jgi:hypothetical protein
LRAGVVVHALEPRSAPPPGEELLLLLDRVESMTEGSTGALMVGSDSDGVILVEAGRVCWAVAARMQGRMSDLLRSQADPPLDGAALDRVFARCRAEGRPLGETLVADGLVTEEGLRAVLLQHTTEALVQISASDLSLVRWVEHRQRRYDARFTFSPVELLVHAAAVSAPVVAGRAAARLAWIVESGGSGAAFARFDGVTRRRAVAQVGCDRLGIRGVSELGEWMRNALGLCRAFDQGVDAVIAVTPEPRWLVAWRYDDIEYVAICDDPSAVACVVARRGRTRSE